MMPIKLLLRTAALLGLTAAVVGPMALLAQDPAPQWKFNPPVAGDALNVEYLDVATYVVKTGVTHQLCWGNPNSNTDGTEYTTLQLAYRRYRVEGGPTETSDVIQYADWIPRRDEAGAVIPRDYCVESSALPKAGHWIFSAQMCRVPYVSDAESCSGWMESVTMYTPEEGGGTVNETPRGWWIYAYLPAPGGVGVD
jgi:hypothetical protein